MMTRKDTIFEYVKQNASIESEGYTTTEISEALGIIRNNVSKELNVLVREGKLQKIDGRPVRYLLAEREMQSRNKVGEYSQRKSQISGFTNARLTESSNDDYEKDIPQDVFENFIGKNDSLKNQVEQAKAAILYPPQGLNVLITGPTGSGKTYFANAMYRFAMNTGVIKKQKFTTFNCADYAHNPQLLMSHLFGYAKGAFTGATEDHDGLIQEADGGMLFLDEVHRLPPEGQEMIFYFMDHGTYNRLGETAKAHHADVRLICATTEDPESSLLQTFVRRIPIMIKMPSFGQRSAREQLQLLRQLLGIEANRTDKDIKLSEDVVKALLGSVTFGNVGQLKSNIQLVCAQAFLNSMQDENEMEIEFDSLPQNIKDGIPRLANNRTELSKLSRLLEPMMVVHPNDASKIQSESDSYELPYNLYEIIGSKASLLKEEGLDQPAINNFILTDINLHLKSFYREAKVDQKETNLNEIVDQSTIDLTKKIKERLQNDYVYNAGDNFIYAMSLHISSFIKRIRSGKPMRAVSGDIVTMVKDYPEDLRLAEQVKKMIEQYYKFIVPESEVYYLAVLLVSLNSVPKSGSVGVVVAAHGNSTAASMVQVVNKLLGAENLASFDMSLEMSPKIALKGIIEKVKEVDQGNGVLLLVDMGSLSTFSEQITNETDIPVKTIDMVTTAMVLEAARKTSLIDSDLKTVYAELRDFNGYYSHKDEEHSSSQNDVDKQRAIIAICSTGEGTAQKIKQMIDNILVDQLIDDVVVVPISVVGMDGRIEELEQNYRIIAATGVANPDIGVPFISLDALFKGGGSEFIQLLEDSDRYYELNSGQPAEESLSISEQTACQYLEQCYTFINPKKVIGILQNYCDLIELDSKKELGQSKRMGLIMHLAGAIERALLQTPISATESELIEIRTNKMFSSVQKANQMLEERLNVKFADSETYYIIKLIDTENQA